MLYLIRLKGKEQSLLKIGFTENINKRLNSYKTYNPLIELLSVKEGNIRDETNLHNKLSNYVYSTEWFIECDEVYKVWNNYIYVKPNIEEKILNTFLTIAHYTTYPKSEYKTIYLGTVSGYREDSLYTLFFKKLNITKKEYKKGLKNLMENKIIIPSDIDGIYIITSNSIKNTI